MNKNASTTRGNQTASHSDLLIKNLRLLDLDEEFDWPRIKSNTFVATSPVHEQKSRVHCAEWILYKLFDIWDPKESTKLAQWFPALEPKQSSSLRVALFRHLSEFKKNGVFGKDIVVRRTMLDDCRGPKFEELLAVFSTIVLHKVLTDDTRDFSVAKQAITGTLALDKQQDAIPLAYAYQSCCTRTLRQRDAYTRRWHKFGRNLRAQKSDLDIRQRELEESAANRKQKKIPKRTIDRLRRHVNANWKGDREWVDILTRSDQHRPQKRMLEREFDEVWNHACADTLYSVRPIKDESLLQSLESRVKQQNERLDRWRSISAKLTTQSRALGMVSGQEDDIQRDSRQSTATGDWASTESSASSARSRQLDMPNKMISRATTIDSMPSTAESNLSYISPHSKLDLSPSRGRHLQQASTLASEVPTEDAYSSRRSPQLSPQRSPQRSYADQSSPQGDVHDKLAAEILSSVMNADPSPFKKAPTLSLADRTRMSMAQMSPQKADLEAPIDMERYRADSPERTSPERPYLPPSTPSQERIQTLAERTRQSMYLMSAKPRQSQARKSRTSRLSQVYPTNQFETPRKPGWAESVQTPTFDETMEELDAESVFKSRPKIALSPVLGATPSGRTIDETMDLEG